MKFKPKGKRLWLAILIRWSVIIGIVVSSVVYIESMPGRSYHGSLQPLSDGEALLKQNLRRHVITLSQEIGHRNTDRSVGLEASVGYIRDVLVQYGYSVKLQEYTVRNTTVKNIEAQVDGSSDEVIVVGAHYDSVRGSLGANDNASGVAATLELARLHAGEKHRRSVRFVLFVNEEPPYFETEDMGSRVYAREARKRADKITGMISLETIGFYSDTPNSQKYPSILKYFYPDTANFIGFISNISSRGLLYRCIKAFRNTTAFPSVGTAAPAWIPGIGWSDHWSFWKEDYPAIMITDTAPFRYIHYHNMTDTPDKLDFDKMARVVAGIDRVVADISN
ncbi:peptidase M28 family peptidase [Candidatus Magnetobacterium bavaricum]|uniref:Peptidase M28 family peptidase n=1 Tax=Candidatus Magnetobacterium bavaricum TaxID=29290 RepID=A0A0F3H0X0_9BACT|nr:peptidase M28 family peptidase [Candidatus Magnetobacterium bavaricum]